MGVFEYRAKRVEGETVTGAVAAPSESVAYDLLKEQQLTIISLKERRESALTKSPLAFLQRVSIKEQVVFARQLAVMINANVPIVKALKILVRQTEKVNFKVIISDILDEVEGGAKFSSALGKYPSVFNNFFVFMVRAGETTGKLDEVLEYLATQKEKDYDLISKMRNAMIYPIVLLGGVLVVGVGLTLFVLPSLLEVFADSGAALPLPTVILIGFVKYARLYWYIGLAAFIGLIVGFVLFKRTPRGRRIIDMIKIKIPVLGQIFRKLYITRFSQSMATLLEAGVPISRSLDISGDIVDNAIYRDMVKETIIQVEAGNSITTVFARTKDMPVMVSQMMAIGEQSGRMDVILKKIADFYSKELENIVANLVILMEPVILMFMGVAVAFLVAAILLPIYNLSNAI